MAPQTILWVRKNFGHPLLMILEVCGHGTCEMCVWAMRVCVSVCE